jgi:hypothetical protein
MLLLAAFCFGLSLLVDQAGSVVGAHSPVSPVAVEDGAKFLGAAMWAQYFVQTAGDIIRSIVASPITAPALPAETPGSEPSVRVAGLVSLLDGRVGPLRVPSGGQY